MGGIFSWFRIVSDDREEFDDLELMKDSEEDSSEEEEEIVHKELKNLFRKLRKCRVKKDSHPTPSAPPTYNNEVWWYQLSSGSCT